MSVETPEKDLGDQGGEVFLNVASSLDPNTTYHNPGKVGVYLAIKDKDIELFKKLIREYYDKYVSSNKEELPPDMKRILDDPSVKMKSKGTFKKYALQALFDIFKSKEKSETVYNYLWGINRARPSLSKITKEKIIELENRIKAIIKRAELDSSYIVPTLSDIANEHTVSYGFVHKVAHKIASKAYSGIWGKPCLKIEQVSTIEELNQVIENYQNDEFYVPPSLADIAKKYGVSYSFTRKRAQKIAGRLYKDIWGAPGLTFEQRSAVDRRLRLEIKNFHNIKSYYPVSLNKIANECKVSQGFVRKQAIKIAGKNYSKIWSVNNLYSKEAPVIKERVKSEHKMFQNDPSYIPKSLNQIANVVGVRPSTVAQYARDITEEDYFLMWPISELSLEKINDIKQEAIFHIFKFLNNPNYKPLSLKRIATKQGVSKFSVAKYIIQYLVEEYGKEEGVELYIKMWLNNKNFWKYMGSWTHLILNSVLTQYFNSLNIRYYTEIQIFSGQVDGLIINDHFFPKDLKNTKLIDFLLNYDEVLKSRLGFNRLDFSRIKALTMDYTFNISPNNILKKIKKYQNPETILLIVALGKHFRDKIVDKPLNNKILFRDNIKIIGIDIFFDLIGLSDFYRNYLDRIINIANNGKLKELMLEPVLIREDRLGLPELRENLKAMGLIRENINEFLTTHTKRFVVPAPFRDLDFFL